MKRILRRTAMLLGGLLLAAGVALARPLESRHELTPAETGEVDAVGDVTGTLPLPAKVLADTIWIADWTFDAGDNCDDTGWTKIDNRIRNDGSNYWHIGADFDGQGGITGQAAILSKHDLCGWAIPTGYGNNWDYSIILQYQGTGSRLSFDFLCDSEAGYDFLTVEADSAGASESRVNYAVNPATMSTAEFRQELLSFSGLYAAGAVDSLLLPDFGQPAAVHEVYLRFASDGKYSAEDGLWPPTFPVGSVVDNIVVTGGLAYTEDFEGTLHASVTMVNTAIAAPFGEWARLYKHITDNDKCTENTTCAWLWTDPLRFPACCPNLFGFGPGQAVIHSWLDDIIVSPWVSMATAPGATATVLTMRRFGGNNFSTGGIVQNWSVRSQYKQDNTDTPAPGDSFECVGRWAHASSWNSLGSFVWATLTWDMTSYIEPGATAIQLRLRVSDWQYIAGAGISVWGPGPGPYNDRLRIGRRILTGPVWNVGIDTRTQAQDCFPTMQNGISPGEHFSPQTDASAPLYPYLFGTCAFSEGTDLGLANTYPNLITGDSISARVIDARSVGGITSVQWYGAIVEGPHAGKAPAPWVVASNGFFQVQADSARTSSGSWLADSWTVDLDDTYFRGGDRLVYFWMATDAAGGQASLPEGITAANFPPAAVAAAELATRGLYEVSFLPAIDWDPAYLARVAAAAHGDLDPTAEEIAGSAMRNCLLYYQHTNSNRRSGAVNRTSFMYALDRLGYAGLYDVYDVQGYGETNNQLGGRATVAQAGGYALIIEDDGRSNLSPNVTDGVILASEKVNQAQWYRDYLAQGFTGRAGTASLWIIGENTAYEKAANPLFTVDMGLSAIVNSQGPAVNPDVAGTDSASSWSGCTMSFAGDLLSLAGGCPSIRAYDAATAAGTAVVTHRYQADATPGGGAVIMNRSAALHWNTLWMGFAWFDIRNASGPPANPDPSIMLLQKILSCLLPSDCRRSPGVTDAGGDAMAALPRVSALHQNTPNPFNPTTTIRFDLARAGHVELCIYDAAGRLVKTLVNGTLASGWSIGLPWTGLDDAGNRVPSGVYFYRLVTADLTATQKMVLMK